VSGAVVQVLTRFKGPPSPLRPRTSLCPQTLHLPGAQLCGGPEGRFHAADQQADGKGRATLQAQTQGERVWEPSCDCERVRNQTSSN
jgi:hypothetical protein